MGICENIQFLSKLRGLPISHLEKELSFANGSIRRWNESSPSIDKVQKVADYLNVSTDYLLGRAEPDTPSIKNPDIRAIARAGDNMSPDEAIELRKFTERLFPNAFKKNP